MSRVSLGNINISKSISEPDFYVAGVVDSQSGFTIPKLISDSSKIDTFYGEFPYSGMYKKLIESNIPVLLTPILTKVSEYNRSSLRVNSIDSIVSHCHPRYKATYEYVSYGNIQSYQFTNPTNFVRIRTSSKTHLPYLLVSSDGNDISECIASSKYYFGSDGYSVIELRFNTKITGEITVESYPSVESNSEYTFVTKFTDEFQFYNESDSIPDIVVINQDGESVKYHIESELTGDRYLVKVNCPGNNLELSAYVRCMPNEYLAFKNILEAQTQISHNLGYYPLIKPQQLIGSVSYPFRANVTYVDRNNTVVTVSNVEDSMTLRYCISRKSDSIDVDRMENTELMFNQILDFSKVSDEDIQLANDIMYFLILVNGTRYLFIRQVGDRYINSDFYDVRIPLIISNEGTDRLANTVEEVISVVTNSMSDRIGSKNVLNFRDECTNVVEAAFDTVGYSEIQSDFLNWVDRIEAEIYARELFLGDYRVLIELFESVVSEYGNKTTLELVLSAINDSPELDTKKLMIKSYLPTQDLNYYEFKGLKISTSWNSTQDSLCELFENDKLIEFYSKVKGPVGESIYIEIERQPKYKSYYRIQISMNSIVEEYYCYTYRATEDIGIIPSDAIDIREISQLSELVEVKLYDYKLPTGRLIDQMDFADYYSNNQFDTNSVRLIDLPSGSWKLARYTDETWRYNDYQDTLVKISETNFYPDLFLVPELISGNESEQISDIYSFVKGNETSTLGGVVTNGRYSQALITIKWNNLQNASISEFFKNNSNRLLYFYDCIEIEDVLYPSFYPYIKDILNNEILKIPVDKLIADYSSIKVGNAVSISGQPYLILDIPDEGNSIKLITADGYVEYRDRSELESIEILLDECKVNYLKYNNLYYYYLNLYEVKGQPTLFIVQYCQSKLSRQFLRSSRKVWTMIPLDRNNYIAGIVSKVRYLLDYVESIDYETSTEGRSLTVSCYMQLKGLVNKLFRVDYNIDLT